MRVSWDQNTFLVVVGARHMSLVKDIGNQGCMMTYTLALSCIILYTRERGVHCGYGENIILRELNPKQWSIEPTFSQVAKSSQDRLPVASYNNDR